MKKLVPLSLACIATTTLFAGTTALAQNAAAPASERAPRPELTRAAVEERASSMFARLDANADGVLNEADREAQARKRFDATDTDGDGVLSFAEVTAAQEGRRGMREERREQRAEARPERPNRGMMARGGPRGSMAGPMGGRMLERADTDKDGTISKAEFTGHALARFDRADTDGDGTISADERRSGRGEGRFNRRQRG